MTSREMLKQAITARLAYKPYFATQLAVAKAKGAPEHLLRKKRTGFAEVVAEGRHLDPWERADVRRALKETRTLRERLHPKVVRQIPQAAREIEDVAKTIRFHQTGMKVSADEAREKLKEITRPILQRNPDLYKTKKAKGWDVLLDAVYSESAAGAASAQ